MISIVCVFNDQHTLQECLLASLARQSAKYELHTLDNRNFKYSSAAEALNTGAKNANGEYIMFVHQDIILEKETWLVDTERILNSIKNLGVAGVAGRQEKTRYNTASVTHGIPPKFVGKIHLDEPVEVQTLDECLILIPRKVFTALKFDQNTCNDWHLYSIDYCLSVLNTGYKNYVIPTATYHKSLGRSTKSIIQILFQIGSLPQGYVNTVAKVIRKHRKKHKRIYTVCGTWNTSYPFLIQRILHIPKDIARHLYWQYRQRNKS